MVRLDTLITFAGIRLSFPWIKTSSPTSTWSACLGKGNICFISDWHIVINITTLLIDSVSIILQREVLLNHNDNIQKTYTGLKSSVEPFLEYRRWFADSLRDSLYMVLINWYLNNILGSFFRNVLTSLYTKLPVVDTVM